MRGVAISPTQNDSEGFLQSVKLRKRVEHNMQACLLKGLGHVIMEEVPAPKLDDGDVLVRLKAAGICGTDLEKVQGSLGPGGILGHEVSGTIEDTGEGVTSLRQGDRVVAHHHVPCYNCYYCSKGDYTMCDEFKATNFDPCGFAEFFRVPAFNVSRGGILPMDPSLSFEEGALIEPTACCLRAINKLRIQPEDNLLVIGLGPTGLTQVQILRRMTSGQIIGSDPLEARRAVSEKMGADEAIDPASHDVEVKVKEMTGVGADMAIMATGNEKAFDQALRSVRKGGRILLFGAPAQAASLPLDIGRLFSRQVSIVTSYSCGEAEMRAAMRLVADRTLDLASLITDRFELDEAPQALEHARSSKVAVKTMIVQ